MLKLEETKKFREFDLPLKNISSNLEQRLSLVNEAILEGAFCILTYHSDINLFRIKVYEGDSKFSDLKISCTLSDCKEISTILTTGNLLASSQGTLQLSLVKKSTLHIDMYFPENKVMAERFYQIIHAIK